VLEAANVKEARPFFIAISERFEAGQTSSSPRADPTFISRRGPLPTNEVDIWRRLSSGRLPSSMGNARSPAACWKTSWTGRFHSQAPALAQPSGAALDARVKGEHTRRYSSCLGFLLLPAYRCCLPAWERLHRAPVRQRLFSPSNHYVMTKSLVPPSVKGQTTANLCRERARSATVTRGWRC